GSVLPKRLGIASGLLAITRTLGQTTGIAVLGALWVSRVTILIGEDLQGGATNAPADIQVGALSDTFIVVAGMIVLALAIVILGEFRERISNKPPGLEVLPQEEKYR
ncbi:MAG: hypothetical protein GTO18_07310, partial [Anaerolineales bacterium]|nr:hypothetical protein [Anaerolineales bacterium]